MPVYPYECEAGHTFEVWQKVSDPRPTECPTCGKPVEYTWPPVGFNASELELNRSTGQSHGGKSEGGHVGDKSYDN